MTSTTRSRYRTSLLMAGLLVACHHPALAQPALPGVDGLPLRWVEPAASAPRQHRTVVFLTGDGGFASLVTHLADGLAARGEGVVMLNSRAYLSPRKTPDQAASAIGALSRAAMTRFHADSVVIVGYSRGADMAPFVVNRWPADLRQRVTAVVMFGLGAAASFEFHMLDLVKDTPRPTDLPLLPELEALRGMSMACIYGEDEERSACRDAPAGLLRQERRDGGHHFDGDVDALLKLLLEVPGVLDINSSATTPKLN